MPFPGFVSQKGTYPRNTLRIQCVGVAAEVGFNHPPPGPEVALWFAVELAWIPHFEAGC